MFSGVITVLSSLLLTVTLVAIAMTVAAIHYYKKDQQRRELVGTAIQSSLHCRLPWSHQHVQPQLLHGAQVKVHWQTQIMMLWRGKLFSSDIPLAQNDAYNANTQMSFSDVPLAQNDDLEPPAAACPATATPQNSGQSALQSIIIIMLYDVVEDKRRQKSFTDNY